MACLSRFHAYIGHVHRHFKRHRRRLPWRRTVATGAARRRIQIWTCCGQSASASTKPASFSPHPLEALDRTLQGRRQAPAERAAHSVPLDTHHSHTSRYTIGMHTSRWPSVSHRLHTSRAAVGSACTLGGPSAVSACGDGGGCREEGTPDGCVYQRGEGGGHLCCVCHLAWAEGSERRGIEQARRKASRLQERVAHVRPAPPPPFLCRRRK